MCTLVIVKWIDRVIIIKCISGGKYQKELKYDGTNSFPKEFLKELIDIKNKYYVGNEVRWIGQNLENEASEYLAAHCIWLWIQNYRRNFDEFVELFTENTGAATNRS